MDKIVVRTILVTLGAAFVLLSVNEWKKLADQIPSDDGTMNYIGIPSLDSVNSPICAAVSAAGSSPAGGATAAPTPAVPSAQISLQQCQAANGAHVPWTQGIKAFVYTWIGVGLLLAAFIKGKGVSGGYW